MTWKSLRSTFSCKLETNSILVRILKLIQSTKVKTNLKRTNFVNAKKLRIWLKRIHQIYRAKNSRLIKKFHFHKLCHRRNLSFFQIVSPRALMICKTFTLKNWLEIQNLQRFQMLIQFLSSLKKESFSKFLWLNPDTFHKNKILKQMMRSKSSSRKLQAWKQTLYNWINFWKTRKSSFSTNLINKS